VLESSPAFPNPFHLPPRHHHFILCPTITPFNSPSSIHPTHPPPPPPPPGAFVTSPVPETLQVADRP
jgi:hypothetical protein